MGRPQFETVVAAAPRQKLEVSRNFFSTVVAAGGLEQIDLFVATGKVARVQSLFLEAAPVAAALSGDHEMILSPSSNSGGYILGGNAYNAGIKWDKMNWLSANVTEPGTDEASVSAIRDVLFDDVVGLRFNYLNNTDAGTDGERKFHVNYVEFDTAK
jgi:hypothetical protein